MTIYKLFGQKYTSILKTIKNNFYIENKDTDEKTTTTV